MERGRRFIGRAGSDLVQRIPGRDLLSAEQAGFTLAAAGGSPCLPCLGCLVSTLPPS